MAVPLAKTLAEITGLPHSKSILLLFAEQWLPVFVQTSLAWIAVIPSMILRPNLSNVVKA